MRLRDGVNIDAKAKTQYAINPADWSETKGQPKNLKDSSFKELNIKLVDFKTKLLNHFNESVGKKVVNSDWLKNFINPPNLGDAIPDKLLPYFDYYALHKKNSVGVETIKKLNVNKHLLERFQNETNKEYLVKDVDQNFKYRIEEFCKKEGYCNNTTAKFIKFIKTICYHARDNGIETHFQLTKIKVKFEKIDHIILDPTEIATIENSDNIKSEHLLNARDWLLISCETGQRVSDFGRFTKDMIRYENNKPFLEFTQVKTKKLMTLPLTKKVMSILNKRNGDFPNKISDQNYNYYIKEVCKLAGINEKVYGSKKNPVTNRNKSGMYEKWELVTSHIGRRSFATNNYSKIPTSLLMYATGHTTEKMFLVYINKSDSQRAVELARYFN